MQPYGNMALGAIQQISPVGPVPLNKGAVALGAVTHVLTHAPYMLATVPHVAISLRQLRGFFIVDLPPC